MMPTPFDARAEAHAVLFALDRRNAESSYWRDGIAAALECAYRAGLAAQAAPAPACAFCGKARADIVHNNPPRDGHAFAQAAPPVEPVSESPARRCEFYFENDAQCMLLSTGFVGRPLCDDHQAIVRRDLAPGAATVSESPAPAWACPLTCSERGCPMPCGLGNGHGIECLCQYHLAREPSTRPASAVTPPSESPAPAVAKVCGKDVLVVYQRGPGDALGNFVRHCRLAPGHDGYCIVTDSPAPAVTPGERASNIERRAREWLSVEDSPLPNNIAKGLLGLLDEARAETARVRRETLAEAAAALRAEAGAGSRKQAWLAAAGLVERLDAEAALPAPKGTK